MDTIKIDLSSQKQAFKKLNKSHTYKIIFQNTKDEEEFFSYWKRYCKRMIGAQDIPFMRKARKYFKKIYQMKNDNEFAEKFYIEKINDIKGYGLFAKQDLKKGEIFTHYCGVLKKDNARITKKNRYVFAFTGTEKLQDWVIDASEICNIASLMNHAEKPNVDSVEYYDYEGPNVLFETLRDVSKGEELTYDYGKDYWEGFNEVPQ